MQRFEERVLTGRVTLAGGAALPAGAVVELTLRDLDGAPDTGVVAARRITASVTAPFLAFALGPPAGALDAGARYGLEARMHRGGAVRYQTPAPVPVPGDGSPLELRLEPVPAD